MSCYMFRTRGFIFSKTVLYTVVVMVRFTCTTKTDACKTHNCVYNRLPEDEPSDSKRVEDIRKLKY